MDERRDPPAEYESGLPPSGLIASGAHLAPPQEAYGKWARHALHCKRCRDIDCERCAEGDELYDAYQKADSEALRRYNRGTT